MKNNDYSLLKTIGSVVLYATMLMAVCIFFEGNGEFIYEF